MKSLYHDKDETYLDDARNLEEETANAIQPILEKYAAMNYPVRQISQVMTWAVEMVEGIFIMERNGKVQKHDRNKDIINA
jgi:hypothetical protein